MKGRFGANQFAFALLAGAFGLAAWQVLGRGGAVAGSDRVVVRLAHAQLETGMREAFAALAADYTALNPGVTVEQVAVPRRTWAAWLRTQLVGGTTPDLVQLVDNDRSLVRRYFQPLDTWMAQPNPHNAGTPLAGVPWQDTFIAPLAEPPVYWPTFFGVYAVPTTLFTMRVYYNRTLLREITGGDEAPTTYEEYVALCRRVQDWAQRTGRTVYPVASSRITPSADIFFQRLFESQTQRLIERIDRSRTLGGGGGAGGEVRLKALTEGIRGTWKLEDPALQASLRLAREAGGFFQPGFLAADRDEALFLFLQGRALMIVTGSWDYQSITAQVPFETGVLKIPVPARTNPDFGRFVLGPWSEANTSFRGAFALARTSRHPEAAMDFMRYLTSARAHEKFARLCGWLPAVRGVEPAEAVRAFYPELGGYPRGFSWSTGVETQRLWSTYAHLLFASEDGVAEFTRTVGPLMREALLADETKESRELVPTLAAADAQATADWALGAPGTPLLAPTKRSELFESKHAQERDWLVSQGLQATFGRK